jgi:Domain of unknown function (DUF4382)
MRCDLSRKLLGVATSALALVSYGCSSSNTPAPAATPQPQNASVTVRISDASTEDWATIGVKVLSISLTPQGGGSDVTVYTAPSPAPFVNLLQLDQLSEILGNATINVGTYVAATVRISGNSSDVILTASADPEPGFAAAPGSTIPNSQIQVVGTKGSSTVPVKFTLDTPLVVTAGQSNALDLEFDLSHPAFIVAHVPPSNAGTTMWAVNFAPLCRQRHVHDLTRLLLRHHYGTVTQVSSDNSTLTIDKDYPVYPPTNPETEITSPQTLNIEADSINGTLFYDLDAKTHATVHDFGSIASTIVGKYIRVAARYQVDGSLVAVRLWASSSFDSVWISPEGHVLHVATDANTLVVENELGIGVPLTVDANTLFYFRTPSNAQSDAHSIGQGPAFLANLERGFKVHASVVDAWAVPAVASSIDIEIARFDGSITGSSLSNFTYTRQFRTAGDDYTVMLPYVNAATPNGHDPISAAAIAGFKWWNFTFPTIVDSGMTAVSDFATATNGAVNFNGTVGLMKVRGESYALWNDPNAPNAWAASWTVLTPTTVPLGTASTGYSNGSFMVSVPGGANAVQVNLNTTSGSATLVYQVDWTNGILTVSPVDLSTSVGQSTLSTNLVANTPVKVYGIPQVNSTIKCYVLTYFTGFAQATTN